MTNTRQQLLAVSRGDRAYQARLRADAAGDCKRTSLSKPGNPACIRFKPHCEIYNDEMRERIPRQEAWLLFGLMATPRLSTLHAAECIWGLGARFPEDYVLRVHNHIWRLREALSLFGYRIVSEYGWGYSLETMSGANSLPKIKRVNKHIVNKDLIGLCT